MSAVKCSGLYLRGETWWLRFTHRNKKHQVRLARLVGKSVAVELASATREKIMLEEPHESIRDKQAIFQQKVEGAEQSAVLDPPPPRERPRVYFLLDPKNSAVKIGWTRAGVRQRIYGLQIGSSTEFVLVGTLQGSRTYEKELHRRFEEHHLRGEWFRVEGALLEFLRSKFRFPTQPSISNL